MNKLPLRLQPLRWSVLAAACLLLAACQDRREPVKPTVGPGAAATAGPAATAAIAVQAA